MGFKTRSCTVGGSGGQPQAEGSSIATVALQQLRCSAANVHHGHAGGALSARTCVGHAVQRAGMCHATAAGWPGGWLGTQPRAETRLSAGWFGWPGGVAVVGLLAWLWRGPEGLQHEHRHVNCKLSWFGLVWSGLDWTGLDWYKVGSCTGWGGRPPDGREGGGFSLVGT